VQVPRAQESSSGYRMVTKPGDEPPVDAISQLPRPPDAQRQRPPRGHRGPVTDSDQRQTPTLRTIHGRRRSLSQRVTPALDQMRSPAHGIHTVSRTEALDHRRRDRGARAGLRALRHGRCAPLRARRHRAHHPSVSHAGRGLSSGGRRPAPCALHAARAPHHGRLVSPVSLTARVSRGRGPVGRA